MRRKMAINWKNEMNKMLAVFDRQAALSLRLMRVSFQQKGLPLNQTFKEYFLRASNNRIKETFDQFETDSMLEEEMNDGAGTAMATVLKIELSDSNDEDERRPVRTKGAHSLVSHRSTVHGETRVMQSTHSNVSRGFMAKTVSNREIRPVAPNDPRRKKPSKRPVTNRSTQRASLNGFDCVVQLERLDVSRHRPAKTSKQGKRHA